MRAGRSDRFSCRLLSPHFHQLCRRQALRLWQTLGVVRPGKDQMIALFLKLPFMVSISGETLVPR
jgi:hypothetical protein